MTQHATTLRSGLTLTVDDSRGATSDGRPVLVLHGGGGPFTVAAVAGHLAESNGFRTLTPTHPGWNGAPGGDEVTSIPQLAAAYLELLEREDLRDVLVVGSSLGGWLGAEMVSQEASLQASARRISGLILIDSAGIDVATAPMCDFFALDARGVAEYSFHDSERFYTDPATLPAERVAMQRANMATMKRIAGDPYMHDPSLLGRLPGIQVPTLVIWGDSDRIMTPAYGAAFAAAIPDARFEVVAKAGHLPQIEQPGATFALIDGFVGV